MDPLIVNARLWIPPDELDLSFARSGGPGGQNVNKTSSKAVLRFALGRSRAVPPDMKERLRSLLASRLTAEGELIVSSQEHREQARNVEACRAKLAAILRSALAVPKVRRPTRPTRSSRASRHREKKLRSHLKRLRGRVTDDGD